MTAAAEKQEPKRHGSVRGAGALGVEDQQAVLGMLRAGSSMRVVAEAFGVTRNTIVGIWNRHGEPVSAGPDPRTLDERLCALHAKLDRVLAATRGVGILAPEPKAGRR
jgi:hypothetical protein